MEAGADGQRRSLGPRVWDECLGNLGRCLYVIGERESAENG